MMPCVGNDEDRDRGLENPLEENPCVEVRQVVGVRHQMDQFIAGDKCENDTGNRHDHGFREVPDHVEYARLKGLRRSTDLPRDFRHLIVYRFKHTGQVVHGGSCQKFLQPLRNLTEQSIHVEPSPPVTPAVPGAWVQV